MDLVVRRERHPAAGAIVLGGSPARQPGGKGVNQAVAAARLLGPGREAFVGAVGDDPRGVEFERALAPEGVDVQSLDTTGAGDAFCGAPVAAQATGCPRAAALERACAAGALSVTRPGAMPSLPTAVEPENLLSGRSAAVVPASWAAPRP